MMQWSRTAVLLALCTPATGFTLGTVARHAAAPRASARMDEESKQRAEEALERAQQRAKSYASEKRAQGPEINPNTYNVLYSAIIGLTLNDLRQNDAVTGWVAAGAKLDQAPWRRHAEEATSWRCLAAWPPEAGPLGPRLRCALETSRPAARSPIAARRRGRVRAPANCVLHLAACNVSLPLQHRSAPL